MNRLILLSPLLFILLSTVLVTHGDDHDDGLYAVSTFECIGLYYSSEDHGTCSVRYKEKSETSWQKGLDLWFDSRDNEYRGSIVGLKPNTTYDIQMQCNGETIPLQITTRIEVFPVGKSTILPNGIKRETLVIQESGTADAYHMVTVPANGKTTLDVMNVEDYNIIVDADYVIIRGLEIKNAARHGILIKSERHHVVIEDCHITHWGRIGGPQSFGNEGNMDSAIFVQRHAGNIVIQRNLIDHPRGGSNDWDTGHPSGPQAISFNNSSGGNIIRYNEIRSTEAHGFNDAIGGSSNYSFEGSPNRDSDIYGNIISHVWDDAIESEGANMNVRIWGNYTFNTFQHIAVACTAKGPLYIFRNVFGKSRRTQNNPLGGSMIKTGERDEFGGGRRYVFHNTSLQPNGSFHTFSGHVNPNTVTRNNIFDCPGRLTSSRPVDIPSDFDYDLYTGMDKGIAKEPHGIRATPNYIHSYSLEFFPSPTTTKIQWGKVAIQIGERTKQLTDPVVTVPNPVVDGGVIIPNFSNNYSGNAPDLGAFELGLPPIQYGRRAYIKDHWAPWELR